MNMKGRAKWIVFTILSAFIGGVLLFASRTEANPIVVRVPDLQMELEKVEMTPKPIPPDLPIKKD